MEEDFFEAFLEEAIAAPIGLPPGMISAARMVLGAASTDSASEARGSRSTSTSIEQRRADCLQSEEARYYDSLVNRVSAAVANSVDGATLPRRSREAFAEQVVNHLAECGSGVATRELTLRLLQGDDDEIVAAIEELAKTKELT